MFKGQENHHGTKTERDSGQTRRRMRTLARALTRKMKLLMTNVHLMQFVPLPYSDEPIFSFLALTGDKTCTHDCRKPRESAKMPKPASSTQFYDGKLIAHAHSTALSDGYLRFVTSRSLGALHRIS